MAGRRFIHWSNLMLINEFTDKAKSCLSCLRTITFTAFGITMFIPASAQELVATKPLSPPTQTDWPQWMGPNLSGVSGESGWSTEWPETGLPTKWTQESGIGFSSISIADARLYTMGNLDGSEAVYCFDKGTGKEIWRHSYDCELVAVLYEGGPGCTPTIDDDRVYATGKEGQLMCLDAKTGKLLWQQNLQEDLGVRLHEWGFNATPLIVDDQVIVEVGRLASYNKTTGKKNWQSELHTSGYGSVRAFDFQGELLLASLDCDGLRINRSINGDPLAFEPWPSPFRTNSTTPIIAGDKVYISTGYNVGCGLFKLTRSSKQVPIQLEEIYTNRQMRNHFNNSILYEGHLYGFDGNSNLGRVVHLKCMNFETGEVLWKHRGLGCGSLMIADGKLILLSDDGRLIIAAATPKKYEQLAESQILTGRCWTVPVLHQGSICARNARGILVCVSLPVDDGQDQTE